MSSDLVKLIVEQWDECPVCFDHLSKHIFQCSEGHLLCESCHVNCVRSNGGKCPSCRKPVDGRARCGEELRAKTTVPCKNEGCTASFKLVDRAEHEKSDCKFKPLECGLELPESSVASSCHARVPPQKLVQHLELFHPDAVQVVRPQPTDQWFVRCLAQDWFGPPKIYVLRPGKDYPQPILCVMSWNISDTTPLFKIVPIVFDTTAPPLIRLFVPGFEDDTATVHKQLAVHWSELHTTKSAVRFDGSPREIMFGVSVVPPVATKKRARQAEEKEKKKRMAKRSKFDPEAVEVGQTIDATDCKGVWHEATVKHKSEGRVYVQFQGLDSSFNEWVPTTPDYVDAHGSQTGIT